ncbi:helix-turn-helix transcriptional regulator [Flavivirga abyssicola]|uniref:helix-turn-helix domain-containing protein n=1 Tax=Flavivirga abyssicola TaxID=3063533 RepID=UPI0026DEA24F|nr:helix-turn-helix transcriptional regulator [Flavivirga sp. MEBiC07777]WVK12578.1 helix-turn-helix transcriptional regulator [Flavivirga sp. MEBiC07777]
MKQPELGKKILELRIAKGLTQEELVEKCNISVRTIQRIEAGEVTPRSHTLKAVAAALDSEFSEIVNKKHTFIDLANEWIERFLLNDSVTAKSSDFFIKELNIAGISAIICFVIGFLEMASDYFLYNQNRIIFSTPFFILVKIISTISYIFYQRGFIIIGMLYKNHLLKLVAFIFMILVAFINSYEIISIFTESVERTFIGYFFSITLGVLCIVAGVAILKLKKHVGKAAKYDGMLLIIGGCCTVSVIFNLIGWILYIPINILEIIILFKVVVNLKKQAPSTLNGFNS